MDALKPESERHVLEEIDKLQSITIELRALVIEFLRRGNTGEQRPFEPVEEPSTVVEPATG